MSRLFLFVALLIAAPALAAQTALPTEEIADRAGRVTLQVRSFDARAQPIGRGSGFFVTSGGVLVTNFHVIEDAERLQIETSDGEIYDNVYYVTADPRRDVAILRVPVEGAPSLTLSSDQEVPVGAPVYVMGNPLGQTGTFSDGLVSARRRMEGVDMVQISAPISPGSSGGPVMDRTGAVIGVAALIMEGGQNLNYAVPVRYIRPLLSTGDVPRPYDVSLLPPVTGGLATLYEVDDPPRSASGGGGGRGRGRRRPLGGQRQGETEAVGIHPGR